MGYLVCNNCGGHYKLQAGEKPEDFSNECECGGKIRYVENLEDNEKLETPGSTRYCPNCGTENPENAKICKSCKKLLVSPKSKKTVKTPQTSQNKDKSKDGILKTWDKQPNSIKAVSVLGVCCVGLILIIGVMALITPDTTTNTTTSTSPSSSTPATDTSSSDSSVTSVTTGQEQAAEMAQSYLDSQPFSRSGLIDQLKYEGFTQEEAEYGVDQTGADWNEQAAEMAQSYLDSQAFSRSGLIDQLKYEGFTSQQAEYGVQSVGL